MELLSGKCLRRSDGSHVEVSKALAKKTIVCFYFAASWCPPCRKFTEILKGFYEETREKGLEIIFVSFDKKSEDMYESMRRYHGPWLAIDLDSREAKALKLHYYISSVPQLIVCRKEGKVLTKYAKDDVINKGSKALDEWLENEQSGICW